jgi:hypothetical protein
LSSTSRAFGVGDASHIPSLPNLPNGVLPGDSAFWHSIVIILPAAFGAHMRV